MFFLSRRIPKDLGISSCQMKSKINIRYAEPYAPRHNTPAGLKQVLITRQMTRNIGSRAS